jgi:hypothetical protein
MDRCRWFRFDIPFGGLCSPARDLDETPRKKDEPRDDIRDCDIIIIIAIIIKEYYYYYYYYYYELHAAAADQKCPVDGSIQF